MGQVLRSKSRIWLWCRLYSCLVVLTIALIIQGCYRRAAEKSDLAKLSKIDFNALVYLEEQETSNPALPPYHRLVLFNLDTDEKHYLTNDNYWYGQPTFSGNGQKILYGSSRKGSDLLRAIQGSSGPQQLFFYDIASSKEEKYNLINNVSFWNEINFCRNDSSLFYYDFMNNYLAEFNLASGKLDFKYSLGDTAEVCVIVPDIDKKLFYVRCDDKNSGEESFKIYDPGKKSLTDLEIAYPKKVSTLFAAESSKNTIYFCDTTRIKPGQLLYSFIAYNYKNRSYRILEDTLIVDHKIAPYYYMPGEFLYYTYIYPSDPLNPVWEYNFKLKTNVPKIKGKEQIGGLRFYIPSRKNK